MKMTSKTISKMTRAELKERATKYERIMNSAYWYDFITDSVDEIQDCTDEEVDKVVEDSLRMFSSITLEHSEYPTHEILLHILNKAQTKVGTLLKQFGTNEQWNGFIDVLEKRVDKSLILFRRES